MEDRLIELLRCVYRTCEDELDGMDWDAEVARVAEMVVQGQSLAPVLQTYLDNAHDCREEFYAMIAMLQAEQAAQDDETSESH